MKLVISEAAERDVLVEIERYRVLGLANVAGRFYPAFLHAAYAALAMPHAGAPKIVRNPKFVGLRTWPLRGFDDFRIYYLTPPETVDIVRVLHGRRDIVRILEGED